MDGLLTSTFGGYRNQFQCKTDISSSKRQNLVDLCVARSVMAETLESDIINLLFLGKITQKFDFSGKVSNTFFFVPFQIYFRTHLCW